MPTGHIIVETYYDAEGNRTCATDFNNGQVCAYYRTQRFGTHETCVFAPGNGKYSAELNRRGGENLGSLIPAEWCPIVDE